MWGVINMENPGDLHEMRYRLETMCRHAVDRSRGQLIHINIDFFGTDGLMDYISHRSSRLRRLTLADSYDISGACLSEAVKRFPELEELSLIFMNNALPKDIETIGKSCPLLKSFTLVESVHRHQWTDEFLDGADNDAHAPAVAAVDADDNAHALAVAKSMPNLHHLALVAINMKNEGLQAILDGCRHLQSLDIRKCFGVDLKGALGKRCCKQIKHLRLPSDRIEDVGWLIGFCPSPKDYHNWPEWCRGVC